MEGVANRREFHCGDNSSVCGLGQRSYELYIGHNAIELNTKT